MYGEALSESQSVVEKLALQDLDQRLADPGRRWRNLDSRRFHRSNFGLGVALAARDNGAGMAHAAAGRRGPAGNKPDHRPLAAAFGLVLQELRGVFLCRATDFTNHDDRLGFRVGQKHLKHRNKLSPLHGIAANADCSGLSETLTAGLKDRLIGERA